jgi:hypothetical protein
VAAEKEDGFDLIPFFACKLAGNKLSNSFGQHNKK